MNWERKKLREKRQIENDNKNVVQIYCQRAKTAKQIYC